MRFTDQTGLGQIVKYSGQRLTRILTMPVNNGLLKLRRVLNPNGFTTRVMSDVRKGTKELMEGKPTSLKDYISLGNYYIAKKLVVILAVLLLVAPVLYLKFLHPVIRSNFLTATMVVNSGEAAGYTGRVKLLTAPGGTVLYEGPLVEGRITGEGALYDDQGRLTYQGAFQQEQYEGKGESFWPNGATQYVGDFSANQYHGRGRLYEADGTLIYDGQFAAGAFEGSGKLYSTEGVLLYEGEFAAGTYEGPGRQYQADGTLLYEGDFSAGRYTGEGKLYENGSLLYQGGFADGQMEGEGTLYAGELVSYEGGFSKGKFEGAGKEYDPVEGRLLYDGSYVAGQYEGEGRQYDPETGALRYVGSFYQGAYEGTGSLYQPDTQLPVYEGEFRQGRYDGQGVAYDPATGGKVYEGEYRLGQPHGAGTQLDPVTGAVVAAGEFREGQQVSSSLETPPEELPPDVTAEPLVPVQPDPPAQESPVEETPAEAVKVYTGPVTENGTVDVQALSVMTVSQIQAQFQKEPESWSLADGGAKVYSDQAEKLGLTLRTDAGGKLASLDVWNDMEVAGAKTGMSREELAAALGEPAATETVPMGESRMISVSQANRYFGRLTNLSPDSTIILNTYQTPAGAVRAVFSGSAGQSLLLEVLP